MILVNLRVNKEKFLGASSLLVNLSQESKREISWEDAWDTRHRERHKKIQWKGQLQKYVDEDNT